MADHNIWKHVKVDPDSIKNNPYLNPVQPSTSPPIAEPPIIVSNGEYIKLTKTDTYAKGVVALQAFLKANSSDAHPKFTLSNGSSVYRPLTFKENIEARVTDYNTDKNVDGSTRTAEQKIELFTNWIDSCTGIAYEKKKSKFKIIPICDTLISLPEDFNDAFYSITYSRLVGRELDSSTDLYNQDLTLQQVLVHPAWFAVLEDDKTLLKTYAKITFDLLKSKYSKESGMGFSVQSNTTKDELRALFVNSIDNNSDACGNDDLSNYARFLRVAPREKK